MRAAMIKEEIDVGYAEPSTMHYVVLKTGKPGRGEAMGMQNYERISVPEPLPIRGGHISDLWKYCRVCACAYDVMVPIYDENGIEMQLEEKINTYLPITVTANDDLPLQMCQSCVDKLNVTHDLIVSCLDANSRFTQCLQDQNTSEFHVSPDQFPIIEDPPKEIPDTSDKMDSAPKVKKKVVVLKLVHSNSSQLSPSVRIAKALEYLKSKKKVETPGSEPISQPRISEQKRENTQKNTKPSQKYGGNLNPELQVAGIAEFCVVTSGKDNSSELSSGSPKFESRITEALGTVDTGTKQRIVEAVQNIVSKQSDPQGKGLQCADCGQEFASQSQQKSHSCSKKSGRTVRSGEFACKECNRKFKKGYQLTIHKQIHKKSEIFSCEKCGKTFTCKNLLLLHLALHRSRKPHLCNICGKRFTLSGSLEIHRASEHADTRPWPCTLCSKKFASKANLSAHKRVHKTEISENAKCEVCNITFHNNFLLKEHLKSHYQHSKIVREKTFQCPQCPKAFPSIEKLKQHEPIHLGVRPYQCGICSIGFIRKGNLTKHYKTHSTEKVITCRVCKATFPSVAGLLNHRKSHSSEEWEQIKSDGQPDNQKVIEGTTDSFHCSVCKKFLSSKLSLSLHMRVHTGEKPYECKLCSKRFTQKPALTYHMRLHTGVRPYECQFCDKAFNSKVGKESHERTHTGERPYKCGQCGTGFRCSANLRQHTWIHTDNRPFECEICKKLFRRREALQVHMRIHTGERPYSCPTCGRSFTQKGDMLKHTRSHSKKNVRLSVMSCIHCGQVFNRKMNYKMHIESCPLGNRGLAVLGKGQEAHAEIVNLKDALVVKDDGDELKTVTITSEDMIPKFSEITIVTNDIQEYEVEYQS